jgi:hypothetical protein
MAERNVIDAIRAEPDAAQKIRTLTAMTYMTADLQATGQLRTDASTDEIRDILWTYHSPEIYDLLVVERGWSAGQYGTFIGQAMIDAVLAQCR